MPLLKDERVFVQEGLYSDLQNTMGRNFGLYQNVTNVHASVEGKKGLSASQRPPNQRPSKYKESFPPLLTTFTLRQKKQAVAKDTKPMPMTRALRANLEEVLGDKNVRMLEESIGFQERPQHEVQGNVEATPPPVFRTVFGERKRPQFRFTSKPHSTKINGKFFWPNMTNELCTIPVEVTQPTGIHDLKSWLDTYGEPSTDRIPTGTMAVFKSSTRRFGKDRSQGSELIYTATGAEWRKEFDKKRIAANLVATR